MSKGNPPGGVGVVVVVVVVVREGGRVVALATIDVRSRLFLTRFWRGKVSYGLLL